MKILNYKTETDSFIYYSEDTLLLKVDENGQGQPCDITPEYQADIDAQLLLVEQDVINHQARAYLSSTDWYVVRKAETGIEIPDGIVKARADARIEVE